MAIYSGLSELSNLLTNIAISKNMHLLLINSNLHQLQYQVQLFSRFESHITAVSNIQDALFVLKKGEFDLIVNDRQVLDISKNKIFQIINNRRFAEPLFIIESKNLDYN